MLEEIVVRDLAVIREARVTFREGLNVVSGASGVGKSLLVQALLLSLGSRASATVVRGDCEEAVVEARFRVRGRSREEISALLDLPLEEGAIVLRRVIGREGRSRATVNGRIVSVAELRSLGERLADVHGQNEEQLLLRPKVQERLLDDFAGISEERIAFTEGLARLRTLDVMIQEHAKRLEEMAEREDLIRFQLREITEAGVRPGELKVLSDEVARIHHATRIRETFGQALDALDEGEDSVLERLRRLQPGLDALAREVEAFAEIRDRLRELVVLGQDLASTCRAEAERVDVDEPRAALAEERLDTLKRVLKKYGPTEADALARQKSLEKNLREISGVVTTAASAAAGRPYLLALLSRRGVALTKARHAAARRLVSGVGRELVEVGLEGAKFDVSLESVPIERAFDGGLDQVSFLFSANAGAPLAPLGVVASGGETSRVMLALRSMLASVDPVPLLVFDEMDSAVGSRFGRVLGQKLHTLARGRQVLCVTHLPQIAAFAAHHVKAEKDATVAGGSTRFTELDGDARVAELAEMIKGTEASCITLEQARELLEEAGAAGVRDSGPTRRTGDGA